MFLNTTGLLNLVILKNIFTFTKQSYAEKLFNNVGKLVPNLSGMKTHLPKCQRPHNTALGV